MLRLAQNTFSCLVTIMPHRELDCLLRTWACGIIRSCQALRPSLTGLTPSPESQGPGRTYGRESYPLLDIVYTLAFPTLHSAAWHGMAASCIKWKFCTRIGTWRPRSRPERGSKDAEQMTRPLMRIQYLWHVQLSYNQSDGPAMHLRIGA